MASVEYYGQGSYTSYSTTYDKVWHTKRPGETSFIVMTGGGTLTASRNSNGTIEGSVTGAWCKAVNSDPYYYFVVFIVVKANGIEIGRYTVGGDDLNPYNPPNGTYHNHHTWSNISFNFSKANMDEAVNITVSYICGQNGGCTQLNYEPMVGSIYIDAYNPWKYPTNLTNFEADPDDKIKPEGSVTLSWTAAQSGTGNTIDKYQISMSISGVWIDHDVGNVTSVVIKPRDLLQSDKDIKPGMIITFAVRAHYTSQTTGYNDGWLDWVYLVDSQGNTKNIRIYKDGIIYYQYPSQGKKDCVAAYFQHPSQGKKPLRYILVKDSSGTKRIIDEYTTHY